MSQLYYSRDPSAGRPGLPTEGSNRILSAAAGTIIYFGTLVTYDSDQKKEADKTSVVRPPKNASEAGKVTMISSIQGATPSRNNDILLPHYRQGDVVQVVASGRIWVLADSTPPEPGGTVKVRHQPITSTQIYPPGTVSKATGGANTTIRVVSKAIPVHGPWSKITFSEATLKASHTESKDFNAVLIEIIGA